jgi:hypothetical protein
MATGQSPDVVSVGLKSEADKFTSHFFSGIFINGKYGVSDNVSVTQGNLNGQSGNVSVTQGNLNGQSDNVANLRDNILGNNVNVNSGPIERILPGPGVQGPTVATMETITPKPLNP